MKTTPLCAITALILISSCSSLSSSRSCGGHEAKSEKPSLSPLWTNCGGCAQPESAYFEASTQTLYVSNVDGEPLAKDKKGHIQKFDPSGKLISARWVSGLNAPKGMRSFSDKLFVADVNEIVVISLKTGKILSKVLVSDARVLNDIAITESGILYISDTLGSKIYKWDQKSKPELFMSGPQLESPNGLTTDGKTLWVASWGLAADDWSTKTPGRLLAIDLSSKKIQAVTKKALGNLDGIERLDNGSFLVSDWVAGKVYKISRKGKVKEILSDLKGAADIGYNPATKTLYVPRMAENQISAFNL